MPVERVKSRTMTEALRIARARLGDDAVVLEVHDLGEEVELVCEGAGPDDCDPKPKGKPPVMSAEFSQAIAALVKEVKELKARIPERRPVQDTPLSRRLASQRVPSFLKRRVFRAVADAAAVAADFGGSAAAFRVAERELCRALDEDPPARLRVSRRLALVGPTGVGKTTTLAKLAVRAARADLSVGLVAFDPYRPAATAQLEALVEGLGIPVVEARDPATLKEAMDGFADCDLVLVDTAGSGPASPGRLRRMAEAFNGVHEVRMQLVLSAPAAPESHAAAWRHFAPLGLNGLILTKLDETVLFGPLLVMSRFTRLPLTWLGTGPDLGLLERATPVRLVRRTLAGRAVPSAAELVREIHGGASV
jgi:flagellar biosynthesis protein FlhF